MSSAKSAEGRLSPTLRKGLAHIRSCEKSGETLKSYAERKGLSVGSLYEAKKKLRVHGILARCGGSVDVGSDVAAQLVASVGAVRNPVAHLFHFDALPASSNEQLTCKHDLSLAN